MSDIGNALTPYPVPKPIPRPDPKIAPATPVAPPAAPTGLPPQFGMQAAGQNLLQSDQNLGQATQDVAAAEGKAGTAQAGLQAEQSKYIEGLHSKEEQELRGLDQGPLQPKQDTLAELGSMFMLVGMAGAFLGSRGGSSAAANAQAALTGIVGGWNKGDEAEIARQKAIFDTNAAYLKDKADKIRQIYKDYEQDALKVGIPTAQGRLEQRLLTEAQADVNAAKVRQAGAAAGAKQAEDIFKVADSMQARRDNLDERYFAANQAHLDRQASLAMRNQFTPEAGDLMAALAEKGISLPTGLRSVQQQATLYRGLLARHPDMTADEIADKIKSGQIDIKAELRETQTAANIAGRVGVATAEIDPMGDLVIEAAKKVPRGSFLPINKLLRTAQTQLQDPALRDLQVKINSLLNAYDVLASRGGTDIAKRESAHKLLTDADSPEALAAGIQAFKQEGAVAQQASYKAEHKYGGGGGPSEGAKSTSKSGKPITFRDGKWVYD